MNQGEKLEFKCPKETHYGYAKFVCLNEFCTNSRIFCFECIKNGDHNTHIKYQYEIDNLFEFFDNQKKKTEELIQKLQLINVAITNQFSQLEQRLKIKCCFPTAELQKFDTQKLNQGLNQMIKYKDITKNILDDINESSNALLDQINKYTNEFTLYQNKQINSNQFNKPQMKQTNRTKPNQKYSKQMNYFYKVKNYCQLFILINHNIWNKEI